MQIFKGKKLHKGKIVNRLIHWAKLNPQKEGGEFYSEANLFAQKLASQYKISELSAAGIIAALSPQQAWDINKKQAVSYLKTGKATGATGERLSKCDRIKEANNTEEILQILGGEKTKNFFLNISKDYTAVCIDRHALSCAIYAPHEVVALSNTIRKVTKKQYYFFAECYKIAAHKTGEDAATFQAIVWNAVREKRNLRQHEIVNPF